MRKEVGLDACVNASGDTQPVVGTIRDRLVEPFLAATCAALGEMAPTEVAVRSACWETHPNSSGDLVAVLGLVAGTEGALVLRFPKRTAAALATRILAEVTEEVDENLLQDCVGEIANVVAGQAKALLADTPYRFTFSLPRVVAGASEFQPQAGLDCLAINFSSDQGEFTMQLFLKR